MGFGFFRKVKAGQLWLGEGVNGAVQGQGSMAGIRITATGTEVNRLCDGITSTVSELNVLDGITATVTELNKLDDSAIGAYNAPGAGFSSATGEAHNVGVRRCGDVIVTQILVDVTGLSSAATADTIIGDKDATSCHIGQITTSINGVIWGGKMECVETPAGGDNDINLIYSTASTGEQGATGGTVMINAGDATKGAFDRITTDIPANSYLYLQAGTGDTAATYTAGQFYIELYGSPS